MEGFTLKAMAKINLGLDVLRRREDGYHEVKMIMQTVNLYDELTFRKFPGDVIRVSTDKEELPADESNLIYKAAKLIKDTYGIKEGIEVTLKKNIPIAAGMAGGSTDAAATLVAANRLFSLNLSLEELCRLGVKIGADVPYCIKGGTVLCEGIGEVMTRLPDAPDCYLVIAKPDINVSTKFIYENLHANSLKEHPDVDGMTESIKAGDLSGVANRMGNVLETVTTKVHPIIDEIKGFLKERGALNALMSGSGPTVFAIFDQEETARAAYDQLLLAGFTKQVFLTTLARSTCQE